MTNNANVTCKVAPEDLVVDPVTDPQVVAGCLMQLDAEET